MALFSICKQINDPRIDRKRVHSADAIVYISMAAVICGVLRYNRRSYDAKM